jgi:glycosyltransferase involved in cell wall biosynthesis
VQYLKWPLYPAGLPKWQSNANPWLQAEISYAFVQRSLMRQVESFNPEVIYAHHTWVSGYVAFRLNQLTGIPYVITDHAVREIEDCARFRARRRFFREVQEHAARMVDVAQPMQRVRSSIFPEIRSVVIHNGADSITEEMRRVPRPLDIRDRLVVSCVASWVPLKGVSQLVLAFGMVAEKFPNAILRLVGDGPERPRIMAAVRASPARQMIHALGSLPHQRALQEMCWSDIFAMISKGEAFGGVFTEAMMAGLPLIWPLDCGHDEVLADGLNGIRVPPWDSPSTAAALRKLLGDADLRHKIGIVNRELAEKSLTWDATAQNMLALFRDMLTESKAVVGPNLG